MVQIENVIEKLNMLFSIGDYDNAEKIIESARKVPDLYNDIVAIYDANLCLSRGDDEQMWSAIKRGLECNPENYELYVMLGEYYWNKNPNQAYLCLENALFYCHNDVDKIQIHELISALKKEKTIAVRNVSFIILSYNTLEYTRNCIESIRKNTLESTREIVIVDNASTDGSVEWLREQKDIVLRENKENSGFPKGCNQGIEVANIENDIFLLNNDTYLPLNALFWLRMGLYENDKVGATGSVTNRAGNLQSIRFENPLEEAFLDYARKNNLPWKYPYEEKLYLVGYALLIKRTVYDVVGDLDERYSPGNHEDNDYGFRILKAGYKNILCKNSFITHYGSKSFGKDLMAYKSLLETTGNKFFEKWNINHKVCFVPNLDFIDVIKEEKEKKFKVLEIGCGCGVTSAVLRGMYPNAITYGVEIHPEMAEIASCTMETVCGDIEEIELPWNEEFFDYILLGDVLPCLYHPQEVLEKLKYYLKRDGKLILCVPNMKHFSIMVPLITEDSFHYLDTGIIRKKNKKLYTGKEAFLLVDDAGYNLKDMVAVTSDEIPPKMEHVVKSLIELSESKSGVDFTTLCYVVIAQKR